MSARGTRDQTTPAICLCLCLHPPIQSRHNTRMPTPAWAWHPADIMGTSVVVHVLAKTDQGGRAEMITEDEVRDLRNLAMSYRRSAAMWPWMRWFVLALCFLCLGASLSTFVIMQELLHSKPLLASVTSESYETEPATKADIRRALDEAAADARVSSLLMASCLVWTVVFGGIGGHFLVDVICHWRRHRRNILFARLIPHILDHIVEPPASARSPSIE
jgi:hypothetical protein